MSDLTPEGKDALRWWGVIEESARYGMTTEDLWNNLRDAAEEAGLSGPGVTITGVNELRSLATRIQNSGRQLERIGLDTVLTHEHIADAPWSRTDTERSAYGIYQVRYQHTTVTTEGPETTWRTSIFRGQLPETLGELQSAVAEDAQALADKYGVSHVDLGSMHILAV